MDIIDYISMGGWVLLSLTLFYVWFVARPIWKKQGRDELLGEFKQNNLYLSDDKKIKFEEMTDEEYADYINNLVNNAQ